MRTGAGAILFLCHFLRHPCFTSAQLLAISGFIRGVLWWFRWKQRDYQKSCVWIKLTYDKKSFEKTKICSNGVKSQFLNMYRPNPRLWRKLFVKLTSLCSIIFKLPKYGKHFWLSFRYDQVKIVDWDCVLCFKNKLAPSWPYQKNTQALLLLSMNYGVKIESSKS